MSELTNRYAQIMNDLQANIKNKEDKELVMNKFQELSMMFLDIIDRLTYLTDSRIKDVESQQKEIETRMAKLQKSVDGIESDIYEDEDNYEFEIVCPYCNHEFVTDIDSEVNTEIECPECHNMIELDWNGEDEECSHECSCCEHDCVAENDATYDVAEYDENEDDDEDTSSINSNKAKSSKNKKNKKHDDNENKEQDDDDM